MNRECAVNRRYFMNSDQNNTIRFAKYTILLYFQVPNDFLDLVTYATSRLLCHETLKNPKTIEDIRKQTFDKLVATTLSDLINDT